MNTTPATAAATRFLMGRTAAALRAALAAAAGPTATVEAEWGEEVVEGSLTTLAHHGARAVNPAPCCWPESQLPAARPAVVGLSHLDLDTMGGIALLMGWRGHWQPLSAAGAERGFWPLAAWVDVHGPHRVGEWVAGQARQQDARAAVWLLHAYWAACRGPQYRPAPWAAGEEVRDVTDLVQRLRQLLADVLFCRADLLKAGNAWAKEQEGLNTESLKRLVTVRKDDRHFTILIREAGGFVNHLYNPPKGPVADGVLSLNTTTGAVTLSWASPEEAPESACTIMQRAFGPEAGGQKGIAGSPRGKAHNMGDLDKVIQVFKEEPYRLLVS